jgi:hypothetical protein
MMKINPFNAMDEIACPRTPATFGMSNSGSNGNERNTSDVPLSVQFTSGGSPVEVTSTLS